MRLPSNDDEVLLLHNPRCSKSRATQALLEQEAVSFDERRYLEDPLDATELAEVARRLDVPVPELIRRSEADWTATGLDINADEQALLAAIVDHPGLLQRPIVIRGARARIGRPPTDVLELLGGD